MRQNTHIGYLLEVFNKLPSSERKRYSILSAISSIHGPKENQDPIPSVRHSKHHHTHSLDLLHNVTLDEPLSGSDVFGEMTEIDISGLQTSSGFTNSLFISDIKAANDMGLLRSNQIYSVLTLGQANKPMTYPSIKGGYRCLPLEDSEKADLLKYMESIYSFIETQIQKGNVLVHCMRGKNRSCAAVVGYLMKKFLVSYEVAESLVRQSRPVCNMKENFVKQLNSSRWKNSYM